MPVIASNEAHQIGRCLRSVKDWCAQIVVVCNDCHDGTETIARELGAEVYVHEWHGYRDQKNLCLQYVNQPWVLSLDADEVVTPELRDSIVAFLERFGDGHGRAGAVNRQQFFMGRWIRHGELFPDWQLRLFRPDEARWGGGHVHESVRFEGKVHRLAGTLEHFADPTCSSRIEKIVPYGDLFLLGQLEKGRRWSLLANVFRPFWRFVRAYFLKLGFLDGLPGLYLAKVAAFQAFHRYSRLYEYRANDAYRAQIDRQRQRSDQG